MLIRGNHCWIAAALLLYPVASGAQIDHESKAKGSSSMSSSTPSGAAQSGTSSASSTQTANEAVVGQRKNSRFAQSLKDSSLESNRIESQEQLQSALLSFWSLSNGKRPPKDILQKAGLSEKRVNAFVAGSKKKRLSSRQKSLLRSPYKRKDRKARFGARNNFLDYVGDFQESFPEYGSILPEMLTVWGETRDIRGFLSVDSMLLQAKMASVIQVLRNRTTRRMNNLSSYKEMGEAAAKWKVATKRYQFSAFEPYDPNLAELALGPKSKKRGAFDPKNLGQHDAFALGILAKVLLRMQKGDILVQFPLSDHKTRHYLTPRLMRYSKKTETRLKRKFNKKSRLAYIRIPERRPKFLAVVPNWSRQDALVKDPRVFIRELVSSFSSQSIPPEEFIYFHGVL